MKYLQLFPSCTYEYYGKDGCIFDMCDNTRIYIPEIYAKEIYELFNKKSYVEEKQNSFINDLVKRVLNEGMGYIYNSFVFHEPILQHSKVEIRGIFETPPIIDILFIEISKLCNLKCGFCDMSNIINGCNSCAVWNKDKCETIDYEKNYATISKLLELNVSKIVLSGGNPFMNWEYVEGIIHIIKKKSKRSQIEIITNGLIISEAQLTCIKNNGIKLDINVLGYDNESYESNTGFLNGYDRLVELIEKLKTNNVDFDLISFGTSFDIKKIMKCVNVIKPNCEKISEYITTNELSHVAIKYNDIQNHIVDTYFIQKQNNRCLSNKIALGLNGDIKVCPMWDETIINVNLDNIDKVFFDDNIIKYWRYQKGECNGCNMCPYQWMCENCTAILKYMGGDSVCGRNTAECS